MSVPTARRPEGPISVGSERHADVSLETSCFVLAAQDTWEQLVQKTCFSRRSPGSKR